MMSFHGTARPVTNPCVVNTAIWLAKAPLSPTLKLLEVISRASQKPNLQWLLLILQRPGFL
jgi:hypothetical protein